MVSCSLSSKDTRDVVLEQLPEIIESQALQLEGPTTPRQILMVLWTVSEPASFAGKREDECPILLGRLDRSSHSSSLYEVVVVTE
jgi:hypothetical protein